MAKKSKESVITFPPPSLDDWRRLYAAAERVKALAPWEWMDESDMFGVLDPETEELGFVSVMGMLGEHFAVALYQGSEGLAGFQTMEMGGLEDNPLLLMDVPQLQLSFTDRADIDKTDREVIKKLNLKYRGANAWPQFRSYCEGFLPWYLTGEEARFLAHALEQLLIVAPRLKENPEFIFPEQELALSADDDDFADDDFDDENETLGQYLVREAEALPDGTLEWREEMREIPMPAPDDYHIVINPEDRMKASLLPLGELTCEIVYLPLPTPVADRGERPYLPRGLFIVDENSSMILTLEMLQPLPNVIAAWERVPQTVLEKILALEMRPGHIKVSDELLYEMLVPLCEQLQIKLSLQDELPATDEVLGGMYSMMGGGF